jgi:hypothetical protein
MRRIALPTVLAALSVATLCVIPGSMAAARNTRPVVPAGWNTYGYNDLLISVPASWTVLELAVDNKCSLVGQPRRPGLLVLGISAGAIFNCPLNWAPPPNLVWIFDQPPGDYGPLGPAPDYFPRTEIKVNGINVYVAYSVKAGLYGGTPMTGPREWVTARMEWYTPGAEEIRGFGPQASRVLHTIRRS